jgi:hypothetical protein
MRGLRATRFSGGAGRVEPALGPGKPASRASDFGGVATTWSASLRSGAPVGRVDHQQALLPFVRALYGLGVTGNQEVQTVFDGTVKAT